MGGLGNQFFQYAAGRALAEHLGVPLAFDVSWYEKSQWRKYLLDNFNVSGKVATKEEIKKVKKESWLTAIHTTIFGVANPHIFIEPGFQFYRDFLSLKDNTYLDGDGHWQSYKYFENIENIIQKELTLKNPLPKNAEGLLEKIHSTNSVSVHIRRADYLAPKNLRVTGLCTPEYYQNAIEFVNKKAANPQFFVFSDDLEWSKTLPFPKTTTYVDSSFGLKDFEELAVMSQCKHNILANSTFSWWAAWLNPNPNKLVVAPRNWFVSRSTEDLLPKNWVQI